jgi:hypothetical protein
MERTALEKWQAHLTNMLESRSEYCSLAGKHLMRRQGVRQARRSQGLRKHRGIGSLMETSRGQSLIKRLEVKQAGLSFLDLNLIRMLKPLCGMGTLLAEGKRES